MDDPQSQSPDPLADRRVEMRTLQRELEQRERELEQRERELDAVLRISQALSAKLSLDEMVTETLTVTLETVGAGAGSIYLHDPQQDQLVFRCVVNPDQPEVARSLTGRAVPLSSIAGQVFTSREARIDEDPAHRPGHLREIGEGVGYLTRNMVTTPLLRMDGVAIGVMQALNKLDGAFDEDDLNLLTIMASRAALALENARLHEEAKAAVLMHYLGDISHDIKNLMTPVQTGIQTLEMLLQATFEDLGRVCSQCDDGLEWPDSVRAAFSDLCGLYPEMIGMMMESVRATQERVREIADAVKGVIAEPVFEPFDVNEVIQNVAATLKIVAEQKGITLDLSGLGDLPLLLVDRKRLYNAVYNLINNAIPETPPGGVISARTVACSDGVFPGGDCVTLEVADTGRGIPLEVRRRLFTDQAISDKPGGTGLGTRIVKNVVDAHGGVITVESEPGHGATFIIRLPLRRTS